MEELAPLVLHKVKKIFLDLRKVKQGLTNFRWVVDIVPLILPPEMDRYNKLSHAIHCMHRDPMMRGIFTRHGRRREITPRNLYNCC